LNHLPEAVVIISRESPRVLRIGLSFTNTDWAGGNQNGGRALGETRPSHFMAFEDERVTPMVGYSQTTVFLNRAIAPTDAEP
jgi:hypothetical protein